MTYHTEHQDLGICLQQILVLCIKTMLLCFFLYLIKYSPHYHVVSLLILIHLLINSHATISVAISYSLESFLVFFHLDKELDLVMSVQRLAV